MSISAPMIEVSGPDGPIMVFRPWTVTDMKEAMAHLQSPEEAGDRFSTELVTFCKEFSPTVHELCFVHALHAEELQTAKKERVKAETDKDLQLALGQAVSRLGESSLCSAVSRWEGEE